MSKINQEEYELLKEALSDGYKWIARDKHNLLCAHRHKPVKKNHWIQLYSGNGGNGYKGIGEHLFQFIQWEDEEPYNIQELIEEYEYKTGTFDWATALRSAFHEESEETEVKKLKGIRGDFENKLMQTLKGEDPMLKIEVLNAVSDLFNQLDEPEVLSQEFIDEHSYNVHLLGTPDVETVAIPRDDLQNLLVPKQELPVIPSYVADWIEEVRKQNNSLFFAIAHIYDKNEIGETPTKEEERIFLWMELADNEEVFARAWLDGYTVEEEQKFYAKAKGWEVFEKNSHHPYWNVIKPFDKDERLTISTFGSRESLTKEEWNSLGLNENNADFVKVEELKE